MKVDILDEINDINRRLLEIGSDVARIPGEDATRACALIRKLMDDNLVLMERIEAEAPSKRPGNGRKLHVPMECDTIDQALFYYENGSYSRLFLTPHMYEKRLDELRSLVERDCGGDEPGRHYKQVVVGSRGWQDD